MSGEDRLRCPPWPWAGPQAWLGRPLGPFPASGPSAAGPPGGEPGGRGRRRGERWWPGRPRSRGGCEEGGLRRPSAWELGAESGNNEAVKRALFTAGRTSSCVLVFVRRKSTDHRGEPGQHTPGPGVLGGSAVSGEGAWLRGQRDRSPGGQPRPRLFPHTLPPPQCSGSKWPRGPRGPPWAAPDAAASALPPQHPVSPLLLLAGPSGTGLGVVVQHPRRRWSVHFPPAESPPHPSRSCHSLGGAAWTLVPPGFYPEPSFFVAPTDPPSSRGLLQRWANPEPSG